MKNLIALATLSLALVPVNSFAGELSPAPLTAAPTPVATASSAAPTPDPNLQAPELADGLIACRLAAASTIKDHTEDPKASVKECHDASVHYTDLAVKEASGQSKVTELACKYGVNAAVTADVADYIYQQFFTSAAPTDKDAGLGQQMNQFAVDATSAIKDNGCDQKFIDEAAKAFSVTHPPETKAS